MIFVGIGANISSPRHGPPLQICMAALSIMNDKGLKVKKCSRWRQSAPQPLSKQPWYINGVAMIETEKPPAAVMDVLLAIEARCGRSRSKPNAARTLDLDLIAFHDLVLQGESSSSLTLPHPRMHERAFVLEPLAELCPDWRHPVLGKSVHELIAAMPHGQQMTLLNYDF